jgi:aspartate aminotransferase-like enzyme
MEDYGVFVAGCLGELKGKAFRVGHMGNICITEIVKTLSSVERALAALGVPVKAGAGVGAACVEWDKR